MKKTNNIFRTGVIYLISYIILFGFIFTLMIITRIMVGIENKLLNDVLFYLDLALVHITAFYVIGKILRIKLGENSFFHSLILPIIFTGYTKQNDPAILNFIFNKLFLILGLYSCLVGSDNINNIKIALRRIKGDSTF